MAEFGDQNDLIDIHGVIEEERDSDASYIDLELSEYRDKITLAVAGKTEWGYFAPKARDDETEQVFVTLRFSESWLIEQLERLGLIESEARCAECGCCPSCGRSKPATIPGLPPVTPLPYIPSTTPGLSPFPYKITCDGNSSGWFHVGCGTVTGEEAP